MSIAGEYENIPSWVADWPHCCDFGADTCDRLRWSAMVLKALKSQQNVPFHRIVWPGLMLGYIAWLSGWIEYYTYFGCLLKRTRLNYGIQMMHLRMEVTENILTNEIGQETKPGSLFKLHDVVPYIH